MWRSVRNYWYLRLAGVTPTRWRPLLAVYYLTYACDFRCPYCADGANRPYYRLDSPTLDADGVVELLTTVRRYCDHLVLTGGEPLNHPQVDEILRALSPLGFRSVVLTTNGYDLAPRLAGVLEAVDHLVISLDTLDRAKADGWYGVGDGALDRILATALEAEARRSASSTEIIVSAVVTPHNIADLYEVYQFCQTNGLRFAASPQLEGVKVHPDLIDNGPYRTLFDFLLEEKKKGRAINGTPLYLQYMRDLKAFRCFPSATLAVSPVGEVFYPCLERGTKGGNLLQEPDLDRIRQQAIERFGPEPSCDNRCHSACALSFGLILGRPWSMAPEALIQLKSRWHR